MTEAKNSTTEKLSKASQRKRALKSRAAEAEIEISGAEDRLSNSLLAAEDGEDVSPELHQELAGLLAKKMGFTLALSKAEAECTTAQNRVFARGIKETERRMRALIKDGDAIAVQVGRDLNLVVERLVQLHANGQQIMKLFHGLRGRNTMTDKGHIVFDANALASVDHLQHLIELHMARRIQGWRYDRVPPYGAPLFAQGVSEARVALLSEWGQLMGLDALDPEDVAAVEADMAADGQLEGKAPPRPISGVPVTQNGETDVEALLLTLPDLDAGPDDSKQGG